MADPKALAELHGIEEKLADLTALGKQMAGEDDPATLAALQARFRELVRSFDAQVRALQGAVAGLPKQKVRLALSPAESAEVQRQTGKELDALELDEPPPRALTSDELVALAVKSLKP